MVNSWQIKTCMDGMVRIGASDFSHSFFTLSYDPFEVPGAAPPPHPNQLPGLLCAPDLPASCPIPLSSVPVNPSPTSYPSASLGTSTSSNLPEAELVRALTSEDDDALETLILKLLPAPGIRTVGTARSFGNAASSASSCRLRSSTCCCECILAPDPESFRKFDGRGVVRAGRIPTGGADCLRSAAPDAMMPGP